LAGETILGKLADATGTHAPMAGLEIVRFFGESFHDAQHFADDRS
jgi:hypothetical protein